LWTGQEHVATDTTYRRIKACSHITRTELNLTDLQ